MIDTPVILSVREDKDDPTSYHGRNRHASLIYTKQTTGTGIGRLDIVRFESSLWNALVDRHGRNKCQESSGIPPASGLVVDDFPETPPFHMDLVARLSALRALGFGAPALFFVGAGSLNRL
jgi:hypothetical protein